MNANEERLTGWVARDKEDGGFAGELNLFHDRPWRSSLWDVWNGNEDPLMLPYNSFPDLTWEDEPVKVEITIKTTKEE